MKLFRKKEAVEKSEYETLRDAHAAYREACKALEKEFHAWEKRVAAMNKDGKEVATALAKAAGLAGVSCINEETIATLEGKLQAKIDTGKQQIKDVIAENSETRKLIDDRDKAEKTMHSKDATADKAEKKSDEKAPQYRDEANKAAEDYRLLDSQLMDRLRSWNKTKADTFSRVAAPMSEALTAPGSVGGGGGVAVVTVAAPAVAAASVSKASGGGGGGARDVPTAGSHVVDVPQDLSGLSKGDLSALFSKVTEQLGKARKERDELGKLVEAYKRDPPAQAKAQSEHSAAASEVTVLEADSKRIERALAAAEQPKIAPMSDVAAAIAESKAGSGEIKARALYDFVAERDEELSLKAGDVVVVVDDSDVDGWWEGSLNGATGFFPGSYVQKL